MPIDAQVEYPTYLQTLSDFDAYLADQFQALNTTAKGRTFAEAVLPILPHLPGTDKFAGYHLNPKQSHDGGIDILSHPCNDKSYAVGQSKLKISSTEELDAILSKFFIYERDITKPNDGALFSDGLSPEVTYVIVTGSDLVGIKRRYAERKPSSYEFYNDLLDAGRLYFVDGKDILNWMRRTYARSTTMPASFVLESSNPWLSVGDVHIGVMPGQNISNLANEYGDGLFFENIREWLGSGGDQLSVNTSILDTIKTEPSSTAAAIGALTCRDGVGNRAV